jgi:type IV pilus assembly protein PilN
VSSIRCNPGRQSSKIETVNQTSIPATVVAPVAPVAPAAPKGGLVDKISTPPNPDGTAATPSPAVATAPVPGSTTPAATTPAPAATSTSTATLPADVPTTRIEITGRGKSFEDVNNFILTLKQSAFFNPDDTHLISADLAEGYGKPQQRTNTSNVPMTPVEKEAAERIGRLKMPKIVNYKIQTTLKRIPSADLMQELERKGAVGLVSRLKSIKQQQPVKP